MKKFILLFFSLLVLELHAQNTHCPTILSPENLQWLRSFQQQLDQNGLPAARLGTVYVPIKVHIVGTNAGDLIGEVCLAIEMGADALDIGKTIHPHPTLGESVGLAAEAAHGHCTDLPPVKKKS
jgi:hypothetical protein